MLCQRYASPFALLQQMLSAGRVCEFIDKVVEFHNEEMKEKIAWECWLHKETEENLGYGDFRKSVFGEKAAQHPQDKDSFEAEIKKAVLSSLDILEGFQMQER